MNSACTLLSANPLPSQNTAQSDSWRQFDSPSACWHQFATSLGLFAGIQSTSEDTHNPDGFYGWSFIPGLLLLPAGVTDLDRGRNSLHWK